MGRKKKTRATIPATTDDGRGDGTFAPPDTIAADSVATETKAPLTAHAPTYPINAELPSRWIDPAEFKALDDSRIVPNPDQRASDIDMAISLYIYGQKQPAIVYESDLDGLVGVTGHTRARAVALLREGFTAIDPRTNEEVFFRDPDRALWVAVDNSKSKEDTFVEGLITNIKFKQLTDVQEARAVERLTEQYGWTLTDAAKLFGYNNTNRQSKLLTLLTLEADIIDRVHEGKMALQTAVDLAGLKSDARLSLISKHSDAVGNVEGAKVRESLRDLYSDSNAPAGEKTAGVEAEVPKTGKKTTAAPAEVPKKIVRNVAALKKFVAEQVNGDVAVVEPVAKFFAKLLKWFDGEVQDRALWNTIEETIKQK